MACRRRLAALPAKRSHCVVPASMRQLNHSPPRCVHMPRTDNGGRGPPRRRLAGRWRPRAARAAPVRQHRCGWGGLPRQTSGADAHRSQAEEITPRRRRRHRRLRGALALPRAPARRASRAQPVTKVTCSRIASRCRRDAGAPAPSAFSRCSCAADRRTEDAGANARVPAFDHAKRCQASGCVGCCRDVRRGPSSRAVQAVPSKCHAHDCFSLSRRAFRMP